MNDVKVKQWHRTGSEMCVTLADFVFLRGRKGVACSDEQLESGGSQRYLEAVGQVKRGGGKVEPVGSGRWGGSGGEPGGRPPDGSLMLGGLQQASVVGHDLVFGKVQVELQRHQDRELEGYQLPAIHSEPLLQFLPGKIMQVQMKQKIQARMFYALSSFRPSRK